jgi:replicative DNA helicase
MAKKPVSNDKEKERRAKLALKSLSQLDAEQIEDIIIGGEQELANRDVDEKGRLTHITDIEAEIDEAFKKWGQVSGISTGLPTLDAKIGGLKAGELLLIGGETNNGKSALAQNIAVNVARGHGVLFISLEMLMTEAGSRIKYMNGGKVDDLDLMFQSEYQIDYRHVDALFKNGIDAGVSLVVLDYLQYLGRGMTLDEVAKMSKLMKAMALKYKVPFIVIVSLRKSDGGKFKRKWTDIEVEDLMGTSAIGYDADVAMVASRKDLDNTYNSDRFWVKIIKSRNMPLDYNDRFLSFKWEKTRITELPAGAWIPSAEDINDPTEAERKQLGLDKKDS